ncbi:VWA domain-containing protein [Pseudomonas sp. PDM15]|uniref:VIT and vWA domain-containing protein n=1 Tax=Pseudomonas sp. PDM15 TaxID=2769303 RepID=UPI001781CDAC|nr:VIT domain-containing protein [Pseudomonas sp. PDM15]MBD9423893.1 VWA domain-containing protein [Pseudomonas sp. PDM15]
MLPGIGGRALRAALGLVLLGCSTLVAAQQDQGESPYFAVEGGDGVVDALPLKSTDVQVRILGVMADVRVVQRYRNEGQQALEARYVFPGSTRAAVYGMTVHLGERELRAQIREKQKAKVEYQQAKSAGKTAALLEQQRENVFQMQVANILPGDEVDVELRYTELLLPEEGVYRFVFPTVVGPRYNGKPGSASHKVEPWIATAHLGEGVPSSTGFSLAIDLMAPTPLTDVASPSHPLQREQVEANRLRLSLGDDGRPANNRDFVLDYRLSGADFQSGVLLSEGAEENFFLALVAPPKQAPSSLIVPREYIFVVDISGSMHGFPLDTAKQLLRKLIGGLRPADSFNVLLFSGSSSMLAPQSQPATEDNIETALALLDTQMGSGGTELLPALRQALAIPVDAERSRSFVVVTDGFVAVEREAFRLVRENLDKANLFAFGIGSSVNRQLIEGLARAGQGEPFVVLDPESAQQEAERLRRMIDAPLLASPKLTFEGLDVYDVEPALLPDLFAERPLAVFGKWRGPAQGRLQVEGHGSQGPFHAEVPIDAAEVRKDSQALTHLWARRRVATLVDQETLEGGYEHSQAILDLGLKYGLLTPYTSFVAVDEEVRNPQPGEAAKVQQPLPLPQGVSNQAIGALVPSTPEPTAWAMLLIGALGMFWASWRRSHAG